MPYSEKLRVVHIAIPKTGTTSVVRALRRLCERHGGELTLVKRDIDRRFRKRHGLDALGDRRPGRAKHLSAIQLKTILGEDYERAFSFSMVRNPWAREVSRYWFTHHSNEPSRAEKRRRDTRRKFHSLSFPQWVDRHAKRMERGRAFNQIDKLSDLDGRIIVDFVGRLESVNEDFGTVCDRIGVPRLEVPHVNGTGGGRRYLEMYDDRTRDLVGEIYARDIEAFGYRFGD